MSGRPSKLKPEQIVEVCNDLKQRRRLLLALKAYTTKLIGAKRGVSKDVVYRLDRRLHGPIRESQNGISQNAALFSDDVPA